MEQRRSNGDGAGGEIAQGKGWTKVLYAQGGSEGTKDISARVGGREKEAEV